MPMKSKKTNDQYVGSIPRKRFITWSILLLFLISIAGGILMWNWYKPDFIKGKVRETVREKSDGLYHVHYEDLVLDEIAGSLSVFDLSLLYDSLQFVNMKLKGNAPAFLINVRIPEIQVRGVITPGILIKNELVARRLELKQPVIEIFLTGMGRDSSTPTPANEIYDQILGKLDLIGLDTLMMTGARVTISNLQTGEVDVEFNDISFFMKDVQVDSMGHVDTSRFLFSKQFTLEIEQIQWATSNQLYNFNVERVVLNSVLRRADIQSFQIEPTLGEKEYVRNFSTQKDRFDLVTGKIRLSNIDFKMLAEGKLKAENIQVDSPALRLFRDLTMNRDVKNRIGVYLQKVIEDLPLPLQLDKIILTQGLMEYKLIGEKSRQPGLVRFSNLHAVFQNVTNDPEVIRLNNIMTADLNANFLNSAPIQLNWQFYLMHPKGRFNLKGTLGPLDALRMNAITVPLAVTRIEKGKINGLDFGFRGDVFGMDGQVSMRYEDLKVSILKVDPKTGEIKENGLLKLAANIIIKNSNPKKNEPPRVELVHYKRVETRSFMNMAWKAVLTGIKQNGGLN